MTWGSQSDIDAHWNRVGTGASLENLEERMRYEKHLENSFKEVWERALEVNKGYQGYKTEVFKNHVLLILNLRSKFQKMNLLLPSLLYCIQLQ